MLVKYSFFQSFLQHKKESISFSQSVFFSLRKRSRLLFFVFFTFCFLLRIFSVFYKIKSKKHKKHNIRLTLCEVKCYPYQIGEGLLFYRGVVLSFFSRESKLFVLGLNVKGNVFYWFYTLHTFYFVKCMQSGLFGLFSPHFQCLVFFTL